MTVALFTKEGYDHIVLVDPMFLIDPMAWDGHILAYTSESLFYVVRELLKGFCCVISRVSQQDKGRHIHLIEFLES